MSSAETIGANEGNREQCPFYNKWFSFGTLDFHQDLCSAAELQQDGTQPFESSLVGRALEGTPYPSIPQALETPAAPSKQHTKQPTFQSAAYSENPSPQRLIMTYKSYDLSGPDSLGLIEVGNDPDLEYMSFRGQEFFFPSRLIGVCPDTDSAINGRTMIVLSVSDHGFVQCLSLCRHESEERASFYHSHAAIYCDTTSAPATKHLKIKNAPVEIMLKKPGHSIKDSCYINFEHTWTLQSHVPVVGLGHVRNSQRKGLLSTYERVQNELRKRTAQDFELE
jgi:hypothetical protein